MWKGAGGFGGFTAGAMAHIRTIGDPAPFLLCLVSEDLNFLKKRRYLRGDGGGLAGSPVVHIKTIGTCNCCNSPTSFYNEGPTSSNHLSNLMVDENGNVKFIVSGTELKKSLLNLYQVL